MSIAYRTRRPDSLMRRIGEALKPYGDAHPEADIELYRQTNVSVRIRVLDRDFRGKSLAERETEVWPLFDCLSEDDVADITMLLLLTPKEKEQSLASFEFDHPTKSRI